jgi:hypothetical protein
VNIQSPTSILLSVSWIDTGYKLSTSSFVKLAANTEDTKYARQQRYQVIAQREDRLNHFIFLEKTFLQDGARRTVLSMYRQIGRTMYIVEMSGDAQEITSSPHYESLFFAFNESIRDHQTAAWMPAAYAATWTFTPMHDRFSMDVPLGWQGTTSEPEENLVKTQFHAPDGNAAMDIIYWHPGEFINMVFAADYAFDLLGDSYLKSTDDIKVTSEIILEDGRKEKITWVSRSGGYAGVIYFEVRQRTQMLVVSFTWNRLFDDIYAPVMETAAATFESRLPLE